MTARISFFLEAVGGCVLLLVQSLRHLPALPRQAGRVVDYGFQMGVQTFPIVALMSFFLGGVLALQTGFSLGAVAGLEGVVGKIVGLAQARELGPLMAAFLLAGRVGSAITAELASMRVNQEVDALVTMHIPPVKILVMPRIVAILLLMPAIAVGAIFVGWFGGMVIANHVNFINLDPAIFWSNLKSVTGFSDVLNGIIKAEVFGLVVVLIACQQGLSTRGGPREIGYSVTRSVVSSMALILVVDYILTRVLM